MTNTVALVGATGAIGKSVAAALREKRQITSCWARFTRRPIPKEFGSRWQRLGERRGAQPAELAIATAVRERRAESLIGITQVIFCRRDAAHWCRSTSLADGHEEEIHRCFPTRA